MSIVSLEKVKNYKTAREEATTAFAKAEKALKTTLDKDIAALQKGYTKALKAIQKEASALGIEIKGAVEAEPKTTKPEVLKLTDAEIKAGLDELFKTSQKLKGPFIFETLKITRTRFNKFLEANVNYIKIEGVRKNTLYVKR
jgi:hypothetical protein